ncbi:MAG: hypothetical protein J3K34DRAFT_504829 [Monoraphidium minutum]|nr:MAG: hypothetical protein J3K34DRAFT_504829 [Monoraphidium minutum]
MTAKAADNFCRLYFWRVGGGICWWGGGRLRAQRGALRRAGRRAGARRRAHTAALHTQQQHRAPQRDTAGVRACSPARGARRRWSACSRGGIDLLLRGRGSPGGRLRRVHARRALQQRSRCRAGAPTTGGTSGSVTGRSAVSSSTHMLTVVADSHPGPPPARPRRARGGAGRRGVPRSIGACSARLRAPCDCWSVRSASRQGLGPPSIASGARWNGIHRGCEGKWQRGGRPTKGQTQGSRVKHIFGQVKYFIRGVSEGSVLIASGTSSGSGLRRGAPSWQRQSIPEWDQRAKYIILFRFAVRRVPAAAAARGGARFGGARTAVYMTCGRGVF